MAIVYTTLRYSTLHCITLLYITLPRHEVGQDETDHVGQLRELERELPLLDVLRRDFACRGKWNVI